MQQHICNQLSRKGSQLNQDISLDLNVVVPALLTEQLCVDLGKPEEKKNGPGFPFFGRVLFRICTHKHRTCQFSQTTMDRFLDTAEASSVVGVSNQQLRWKLRESKSTIFASASRNSILGAFRKGRLLSLNRLSCNAQRRRKKPGMSELFAIQDKPELFASSQDAHGTRN